MIRLMLTLAPVVCIIAAIALNELVMNLKKLLEHLVVLLAY